MASARKLTPRQAAFALNFVRTGQVSQSYRDAYQWRGTDKALSVSASRLLAQPNISLEIDRLRLAASRRTEITVDRVMQEYARIAFVDIADCFDEGGNLKPISELPEDARRAISGIDVEDATENRGRVRKVRLSDKRAALDSLAKILGMFQEPESKGGDTFVLNILPAGHQERPAIEIQPELEPGTQVKAVVRRI